MRIRIEIIDDLEDKTSMEFEGRLCKERLINFIEAYDFTIQESDEKIQVPRSRGSEIEELTIKGRMESFLKFDYHNDWFTSLDVKQAYDSMYEENINISTVSTYLSRMYRDG
ncbi:MAG: hypothetical protein SVJ22_07705, partial [Halobacteriota archaeon]|nr:hypothetical protein [Halobacteriota archaeon]